MSANLFLRSVCELSATRWLVARRMNEGGEGCAAAVDGYANGSSADIKPVSVARKLPQIDSTRGPRHLRFLFTASVLFHQ
jgi:hypothetical protein